MIVPRLLFPSDMAIPLLAPVSMMGAKGLQSASPGPVNVYNLIIVFVFGVINRFQKLQSVLAVLFSFPSRSSTILYVTNPGIFVPLSVSLSDPLINDRFAVS